MPHTMTITKSQYSTPASTKSCVATKFACTIHCRLSTERIVLDELITARRGDGSLSRECTLMSSCRISASDWTLCSTLRGLVLWCCGKYWIKMWLILLYFRRNIRLLNLYTWCKLMEKNSNDLLIFYCTIKIKHSHCQKHLRNIYLLSV